MIACAAASHVASALEDFTSLPKAIQVHADVSGGEVSVDVQAFIDATPRRVWSVFTDYDHMTQFVSNLEKSAILERKGQKVLVLQRGTNRFGPFSSSFESLREIQLTPFRLMHSRGVAGNVKDYEATTRFVPEGTGTRVLHHVQFAPSVWVPPVIGPAIIERETRIHFEEFFEEIAKRMKKAESPTR